MLCKSFSVPSDSGSLLCAQALPGLERGLVTLQVQRARAHRCSFLIITYKGQ
jgi:hypothetical protein